MSLPLFLLFLLFFLLPVLPFSSPPPPPSFIFRDDSGNSTVYFMEEDRRRLVLYRGPHTECRIFGADTGKDRNHLEEGAFQYVDSYQMRSLLRRCDSIHARLFNSSPESFLGEEEEEWRRRPFSWKRRDDDVGGEGGEGDGAGKKPSPPPSNALGGEEGRGGGGGGIWSWNIFNRVFILPGTKWCGQGDVAEHYNDLGYHSEEDKCCRSHDICLAVTGEFLSPGQCKNGLCNYSPFTRSPCSCDRQLSSCLHDISSRISDALGRIFFNIAGMSCYEFDHPVKRCLEYVIPPRNLVPSWVLTQINLDPPQTPRCRRYQLDETRPKVWQFFQTFYEEGGGGGVSNSIQLVQPSLSIPLSLSLPQSSQQQQQQQQAKPPGSEEPRSASVVRGRRQPPLSMFQQFMTELVLKIVDPD